MEENDVKSTCGGTSLEDSKSWKFLDSKTDAAKILNSKHDML